MAYKNPTWSFPPRQSAFHHSLFIVKNNNETWLLSSNKLKRNTVFSAFRAYMYIYIYIYSCNGIFHTHSQSYGVTVRTVSTALYLSLLREFVTCLTIPCLSYCIVLAIKPFLYSTKMLIFLSPQVHLVW